MNEGHKAGKHSAYTKAYSQCQISPFFILFFFPSEIRNKSVLCHYSCWSFYSPNVSNQGTCAYTGPNSRLHHHPNAPEGQEGGSWRTVINYSYDNSMRLIKLFFFFPENSLLFCLIHYNSQSSSYYYSPLHSLNRRHATIIQTLDIYQNFSFQLCLSQHQQGNETSTGRITIFSAHVNQHDSMGLAVTLQFASVRAWYLDISLFWF